MGISPGKLFNLTTNIAGILRGLEAAGIRLEIGDDFAKYLAYRRQQHDRGSIYAMFDVERSFIDRTNGFWVCGFNSNGDVIHTQAVRLLDLTGIRLGTHLNDHRHKYITPDTTPDPDQTYFSGAEALHTIAGRVCYHGDFWLHARGLGGPRSQGATALLSRVLLEIMTGAWNPSFVFALVPKQLGAKGAHLRYGYCHCELGRWLGPDQQVTEEEYLIWMSDKDLAHFAARTPNGFQRAAGVPELQSTSISVDAQANLDASANT